MTMKYFLLILSTVCFTLIHAGATLADSDQIGSKRIEVYPMGQSYWDVNPGDTLGDIVAQLLPDHSEKQKALMLEIIKLNPKAFSEYNPDFLKANVRLWLPGYATALHKKINTDKYKVRSFSWGYIQTRK